MLGKEPEVAEGKPPKPTDTEMLVNNARHFLSLPYRMAIGLAPFNGVTGEPPISRGEVRVPPQLALSR